jgi:hypothetical protein
MRYCSRLGKSRFFLNDIDEIFEDESSKYCIRVAVTNDMAQAWVKFGVLTTQSHKIMPMSA